MQKRSILTLAGIAIAMLGITTSTFANYYNYNRTTTYKVTVQNVTKGVIFTPVLTATHRNSVSFYDVGSPASEQLAAIAEGGDVGPLKEFLDGATSIVTATAVGEGLVFPGQSVEFTIEGDRWRDVFSLSAMLLPTNDTFVGLRNVRLPRYGKRTYRAVAYDAGSEENTEICADIPGPQCGGDGSPSPAADGDEGYIYPSPGISGEAELSSLEYNWADPVALVTVERMN